MQPLTPASPVESSQGMHAVELDERPWGHILPRAQFPTISAMDSALVVVDMQFFDAHRDWGEGRTAKQLGVASHFDEYFAQIDAITQRIRQLLTLFRSQHMEVIHLHVAELTNDSRDVGWKQLVRGLVVPKDSKEAAFLEGLEPIDDELIVSKSSSGVFPVTNFDRILRNMGIKTLIFTGTSTGGCVESAVCDAVDLGYNTIVVDDACADATLKDHRDALRHMAGALSWILSTAELEELVEALPIADVRARSGLERVRSYTSSTAYQPENSLSEEVNPYTRIFGPAVTLDPHPTNTALVLIDVQRLTCDPSCGFGRLIPDVSAFAPYYERVRTALAVMRQVLQAGREYGYTIIHVRTAGQLPNGGDLSRKLRSQGLQAPVASLEAEFMPEVLPLPGEVQLNKPAGSIFIGTGLDELLRNAGVHSLTIAGISFDGAVEASIRGAGDRGYGVLVVPDACAASISEVQQHLWNLEGGRISVASAQEAVVRLAAHRG